MILESDDCMTNLLGTQPRGQHRKCVISDACWERMTRKDTAGYYTTHQALYLLLAQRLGFWFPGCL